MSNLPLQPMTTAPREGSWIWCVFSQSMVRVRWEAECQRWRSGHFTYTDEEFSGWLDIPALVRDSERLDWLQVHYNMQNKYWYGERTLRDAVDMARAAIDKERSNG